MTIIVDQEDQWLLSAFSWCKRAVANSNLEYAQAYVPNSGRGKSEMKMQLHHCIVGRPIGGLIVDHRNRNGLDNRRCNLRIVTTSVNQHNTKLRCDNTSGFKGVNFNKLAKKWGASIQIRGVRRNLGYYTDKQDAIAAYKQALKDV